MEDYTDRDDEKLRSCGFMTGTVWGGGVGGGSRGIKEEHGRDFTSTSVYLYPSAAHRKPALRNDCSLIYVRS